MIDNSHGESRIAVAHEHYLERGGGEHVADELARSFDADVYAGLVRPDATADDIEVSPICDGILGAAMERSVAVRDLVYWQAWRHAPDLHEYDVVVQSGNNPGWYVPRDDQTVVKYVHSPQRTPYDRWARTGHSPSIFRRVYTEAARQFYEETISYPEIFVANSELVGRRCRMYWGVPEDRLEVVYPPVDVESFGADHAASDAGYYFTFSRLYPSKRIDRIVEAFSLLGDDYRLVVGGDGPERDRLERLASDTVEFVGYVSEAEKRRRLAECNAFLFAAENEDFGLCPIEAFASGVPVLGVNEGYTQHQIREGESGMLFDPTPDHVAETIEEFDREGVSWGTEEIEAFADQFGRGRFRREMRHVVSTAEERSRISVSHGVESDEIGVEQPRIAAPNGGSS